MNTDPTPAAPLQVVASGPGSGCPRVEGRCPACGARSLFLGAGARVTCASLSCTSPCAVDDYLDGAPGGAGTATPPDVADVLSRPWMARDSRVLDAAGRELFLIHNVENWRHDQVATWLVDLVNVAATPGEVGSPPDDQASADLRSLRRAAVDVLDEIDRTGQLGEDDPEVGCLRDALSGPVRHAEMPHSNGQVPHSERVETAAQVLHDRRHPLGYGHTCDRCRADARAVAAVLTPKETP